MRRYAWLFAVLLLVVGLVPSAQAQIPFLSGSGTAVSFFISTSSKFDAPAGQINIWFGNAEGKPTYDFVGNPNGGAVRLPGNDPAIVWCYVQVQLIGKYANQPVGSTWQPVPGQKNIFASMVTKSGPQPAQFWFNGKTVTYLNILFFSIRTGSRTETIEKAFSLLVQGDAGLTTYAGQLEIAQTDWPLLPTADHELWARTYVVEHWYQAQGLVPRGTEMRPATDTDTLSGVYSRRELRAEAEAKAKADADAAKARADAEAKVKAEADAAQAERDRLAAEAAKPVSWSVTFPDGKVAVEVTRKMYANDPGVISRSREGYGWKNFPGVSPQGTFYLRAKYADGSCDAWRQIVIGPGITAQFDKLPEFPELPKEVR